MSALSRALVCYDVGVQDMSQIPWEQLAGIGARHANLRLLLLFGSRARGDAQEGSDWDLGYLAREGFDPDTLLLDLVNALGTDRIDLVDLARAGAQVRFRAAGDGRALYEREPGLFARRARGRGTWRHSSRRSATGSEANQQPPARARRYLSSHSRAMVGDP
jgi:predicted nucleotidyltransferase